MGDRTTVTLEVLNEDADEVNSIEEAEDRWNNDTTTLLTYIDVNYGELRFTRTLQLNCIPYIMYWEQGGDYDSGREVCLYTDTGTLVPFSYMDSEANPRLVTLLSLCETPEKLVAHIQEHAKNRAAPPWSIQREQSLIARAKKLIGA